MQLCRSRLTGEQLGSLADQLREDQNAVLVDQILGGQGMPTLALPRTTTSRKAFSSATASSKSPEIKDEFSQALKSFIL